MIPIYYIKLPFVTYFSVFVFFHMNANADCEGLESTKRIRRLTEFDFIHQDPVIEEQAKRMWNITNGDAARITKHFENTCDSIEDIPPDFRAEGRRISEVKCLEYIWRVRCDVAIRKQFLEYVEYVLIVVGGNNAEIGELPHMGAIGWSGITPGTWIFKCGGVLISSKYVLTVAHCSRVSRTDITVSDPFPKIVRFGAVNILGPDMFGVLPKEIKISKFIIHDKYKSPKTYYDIALIELETHLDFSRRIHPACVWTSDSDITGKATLSGWGVVDTATRETSATLQIAAVDVIPSDECNNTLKTKWNRNWSKGLASHQICAGHAEGGIDSCQGDSGGPLQVKIKMPIDEKAQWRMHYVIGLTSFGFGCAQAKTPSVYTRVASFIDWIEDVVWKK